MNSALAPLCFWTLFQTLASQAPPGQMPNPPPLEPAVETPKNEEKQAEPAPPPPPEASVPANQAAAVQSTDVESPIIQDLAAAASDPQIAPLISATIVDHGTGVAQATVFYRLTGETDWKNMVMTGGSSGLFLARLPEGSQHSGFSFYVEAVDVAGNPPTRIGSAEEPTQVPPATESTADALSRAAAADVPMHLHPAWVMLGFGVGVVGSATSAIFILDLVTTFRGIERIDNELDRVGLAAQRREELEQDRAAWQDAQTSDIVVGSVAGVIGIAGLATGVGLLIAANATEE